MFYLIVNSMYHLNFKTYIHWDITRLMGSGAINVRRGPIEHLFKCLLAVGCPKPMPIFCWVISIKFGCLCASTLWNLLTWTQEEAQSSREYPLPPMASSWPT